MSTPVRTRAHRLLAALLLGASVATASGASLLELAWHLRHSDDVHARTPHFEAAGGSAHADHCRIGLVHGGGRLPEGEPARPRQGPLTRLSGPTRDTPEPESVPSAFTLPRAPPASG